MKAERNKTIDFLPEDAPEYLARCLRVTEDVPLDAVCGRTICGDTFQVAPHLPRGFADLLIVDPPYNLTKDFSGGGFRRTTDANYAAFTRAWIELLLPLLKPDASVYVCCDWRSSPVIGMTLKDYFRLQNRITWQREKGRGAQRNWKNGMEDIWFATRTDDYTFHGRRREGAPPRARALPRRRPAEGLGGDTGRQIPQHVPVKLLGRYLRALLVHAGKHRPPDAKARKAAGQAHPRKLRPRRHRARPLRRLRLYGRDGEEARPPLRRHRAQRAQYCAWAEKRLELAETNPAIQGYADGVFWERNAGRLPR